MSSAAPDVEWAGTPLGLNAYRYVPGVDPTAAMSAGRPTIVVEEAGPLVATLRVESDAPGARRLVRRLTLVAGDDSAWLDTTIDKTKVRDKESAHIAFPFNMASATVRVDEGEALVTIGKDQLPGSCSEFIGPHSAVDVSDGRAGVSVASLDAPLVEIGALTDERHPAGLPRSWRAAAPTGGSIFGYLLNNYWHTNYKADQEGELHYRFVLRPHGPFDAGVLRRFSARLDQPLVVSRISSAAPMTPPPFELEGQAAIVSAMRPLEGWKGLLVRLYNPTPEPTTTRLAKLWKGRTVTATAPGERRTIASGAAIELKPFASVVLEVTRAVK
jgi:hypothetical protein